MDAFVTIRRKIPKEELLAQLAEESVELAHAALKLRRVYDGTNPTPVHHSEAFANLKEELADVSLIIDVLGLDISSGDIMEIQQAKLKRWLQRLGGGKRQ